MNYRPKPIASLFYLCTFDNKNPNLKPRLNLKLDLQETKTKRPNIYIKNGCVPWGAWGDEDTLNLDVGLGWIASSRFLKQNKFASFWLIF